MKIKIYKSITYLLVITLFGCTHSLKKKHTDPLCTQISNISLCGSTETLKLSTKNLGITFDLAKAEDRELKMFSNKFSISYQELQSQLATGDLQIQWQKLVGLTLDENIFDVLRRKEVLLEAAWMVPQVVQPFDEDLTQHNVDNPISSTDPSLSIAKEICNNDSTPPAFNRIRKQACKKVEAAKAKSSSTIDKTDKQIRALWTMSLYLDHLHKHTRNSGGDLYLLEQSNLTPRVDQFGNLYVSRKFIDSLNKQEIHLLFLHEAGHLALLFSEYSLASLMKSGVNSQAFGKSTNTEIKSYTRFLRHPNEPLVDLYALSQLHTPAIRSTYRKFVQLLEETNIERLKLIQLGEYFLNAGYPLERLLAVAEFSINLAHPLSIENLKLIEEKNQTCLLTRYTLIHANWQIERFIGWIIEDGRSTLSPWDLRDRINWLPRTDDVSINC